MSSDAQLRFTAFVAARQKALGRLAFLLAPDREAAADLLQVSLERAWRRWAAVERADDPFAYVRRILANAAVDSARRRRARPPETALAEEPRGRTRDGLGAVDARADLRRLLAELPARQRAVVVLRYYADLTERDTAEALGISVGSVKTHASRGLAQLRLLAPADGRFSDE